MKTEACACVSKENTRGHCSIHMLLLLLSHPYIFCCDDSGDRVTDENPPRGETPAIETAVDTLIRKFVLATATIPMLCGNRKYTRVR